MDSLPLYSPGSLRRTLLGAAIFLAILLSLFIWSGPPIVLAQAATSTPAPPTVQPDATPLPGVPVEIGGRVIFYVRERIGSLTPAERAALIQARINRLASEPFAEPPEITLVESPEGIDLMADGAIILTVTDRDAAAVGLDRVTVANRVAEIVSEEVERTRALNTPTARLVRIGLVLLITALFFVILFVINRFYHRLVRRIDEMPTDGETRRLWGRTRTYRSGAWKRLVKLALNMIRLALIVITLIILVPWVLGLFPQTAKIAVEIAEILLIPAKRLWSWLVNNQSNFLTIAIIIVVTYLLTRLVRAFFAEVGEGNIRINGFEPEWAQFTGRMVAFLLIVGTVIVAFPYLPGSDSDAFRGITIFLGALFTLSSTAAVANIVAGVIQTYTGAFRVGDVVMIGTVTGFVIEKRLLATRVRTFKNEEVSIPNAAVLGTNVVNYTTLAKDQGLILYTTITIGYDAPWQQVQNLLIDAALSTPDILATPAPFVLQTSLNDYHVSYQINCYTSAADRMPRVYSALHQSIQDKFNEAGVEIMSPAFTALRDGNTVTIPADHRPKDYESPAFQVLGVPSSKQD